MYGIRTHLVVCKGSEGCVKWCLYSAELEVEKHLRICKTKSGKLHLYHFYGTTMSSFQMPHKATFYNPRIVLLKNMALHQMQQIWNVLKHKLVNTDMQLTIW